MSKKATPTSLSATTESAATEVELPPWPALPTETEIYILPDGRVIVADLPAELAPLLAELGWTANPSSPLPSVIHPHEQ
jgi:hypothetical protein